MDLPELRRLALFDGTDDEQLQELLSAGTEVAFRPGEELFRAGQRTRDWWILLEGRLDLHRTTSREQVVVFAMDQPGQWIGALGAWDEDALYFLTGRAASPGRVLRIPVTALRTMSSMRFPLVDHLIEGLTTTLRRVESTLRDREALVGLGTLAAGLAHELNNPASAASRAVSALGTDLDTILAAPQRLAVDEATRARFGALEELGRALDPLPSSEDPVALADREEAVAAALTRHRVGRPWAVSAVLARAGADVDWCDRAAAVLGDALEPGLDWIASTLSAARSLREAK